ncbi:hypothetical protein HDU98_008690, partial [Podochytrium sp. JEL0797]
KPKPAETVTSHFFPETRLEIFGAQKPTQLTLLRSTNETTKEYTNRNKFTASVGSKASTLHYTRTETPTTPDATTHHHDAVSTLISSLPQINTLLAHTQWVLLLEPGALLADPISETPFLHQLDSFLATQQHFILFKHCDTPGLGSLLIHKSMRDRITGFMAAATTSGMHHDVASIWSALEREIGTSLVTHTGAGVFTCESTWLTTQIAPPRFTEFTIHDRISADTIRLSADYYFGDMPIPDLFVSSLEKGIVVRIRKEDDVEALGMRNGTVIFVDAWQLGEFVDHVAPKIGISYVLISGDGDGDGPAMPKSKTSQFAKSPLLLRWYVMNCNGIEAGLGKITCMPIGLNQWGDKREKIQEVIEHGHGLNHGLEWKPLNLSAKLDKYLLASFGIGTNPGVRQPVYDYFCNSTRSHTADVVNCQFGAVDQLTFYSEVLAASRFAISPHGNGLDCYRTYEALLLNVIPIVKTSSLDSLYEDLPVLVLQSWEDLTVELMAETEVKFAATKWNFRKLYAEYWYHKVREGL